MVTRHFDLVSGLFWAPRAPKRAFFGPKRPFWGLQRDLEGPEGPALVPTAANWYDWAGIMVKRHIDLVSGLFWAPRAPKRTPLASKGPKMGPKLKIFANQSCDVSKFAREGHLANKKKSPPFTIEEKNPKKLPIRAVSQKNDQNCPN